MSDSMTPIDITTMPIRVMSAGAPELGALDPMAKLVSDVQARFVAGKDARIVQYNGLSARVTTLESQSQAPGPQGPKGDTGAQGVAGAAGAQGSKGDTGVQGIQGPKGDTGVQGVKGDAGTTGAQGVQGVAGSVGPKGDTGAQGVAGAAGAKGDTGPPGPIGLTGSQGAKGDTGATGSAGPQGATGPQGAKGVDALATQMTLSQIGGHLGNVTLIQKATISVTLPTLTLLGATLGANVQNVTITGIALGDVIAGANFAIVPPTGLFINNVQVTAANTVQIIFSSTQALTLAMGARDINLVWVR